jgi:hypothetical protein
VRRIGQEPALPLVRVADGTEGSVGEEPRGHAHRDNGHAVGNEQRDADAVDRGLVRLLLRRVVRGVRVDVEIGLQHDGQPDEEHRGEQPEDEREHGDVRQSQAAPRPGEHQWDVNSRSR